MKDEKRTKFWGGQIDSVIEEIARNALLCGAKVLDPGVIERVIKNDETVCGQKNPAAFKKLRQLLMLGALTRGKAADKIGAVDTEVLISTMRERIGERYAGKLGGSA